MSFHNQARCEHLQTFVEECQLPIPSHAMKQRVISVLCATLRALTADQLAVDLVHDTRLLDATQDREDRTKFHTAIRLPEVLRLAGISRSSWYGLLNRKSINYDATAPQPFKIGRSSLWWRDQVIGYLLSKSETGQGA